MVLACYFTFKINHINYNCCRRKSMQAVRFVKKGDDVLLRNQTTIKTKSMNIERLVL